MTWYQWSRCKWLQFGDRNTRIFHATTVITKRRNEFDALKDTEGNWIIEEETAKHGY